MATNCMNKLILSLAVFALCVPAFAQSQGVSMRATNGIAYGTATYFRATSNHVTGSLGVAGTLGAATATASTLDVSGAISTRFTNQYVWADGNGVLRGTNDGAGLTNIQNASLPSNLATNNGNNRFSTAQTVNGAFTNTGFSSTTTNYATKLRVGGAAENADAVNVTGAIRASGQVTGSPISSSGYSEVAPTSFFSFNGRSQIYSPANGRLSFVNNTGVGAQIEANTAIITNGIASYSPVAAVAIAATGWTNIWGTNNATIYFDGTAIFFTNRTRAWVAYYTNLAGITWGTVSLQPGESVQISGTGVTGVAKPF